MMKGIYLIILFGLLSGSANTEVSFVLKQNHHKNNLIGKWRLYAYRVPWVNEENKDVKKRIIEFTESTFTDYEETMIKFKCNYSIIKDQQFFYGDSNLIVCDSKPIYSYRFRTDTLEIYELVDDGVVFLYKKYN